MSYYYLKTLHHLLVIIWVTGLIYTLGVFFLSSKLTDSGRPQITAMAMNIWRYAAWPGMILGVITGMAMLHLRLFHMADVWMQVKLIAVILLVVFHVRCHILFKRALRFNAEQSNTRREPQNTPSWNRLIAVGATFGVFFLFLMGLKDNFQWVYGTVIATIITAVFGLWLTKKTS